MNKTAIRNFAIWARNKFIADVSYQAGLMGITKNGIAQALPQSTSDVEFYDIGTSEPYSIRDEAIIQRKSLVEAIRRKEKDSDYETAYNSVIEEVAYTWFNRLIAVRFMEVNDYLPAHVRVLSSESGKQEPDIVTTPFDAELFFLSDEKEQIVQMKNDNKLDDCFRMLFIKQCRELSKILPRLFEGTNDYTELLLSLSYIDQDGVIYHLIHDIPEDDFNVEKGGQVEIIGWLYQYYNAELKDETFALLKNNVKVTKERVPSATQLFTPDWIVRYMVENSLGRLWVEGHPNDMLKSRWKYYLDEAEQEASVIEELDKMRSEYAKLNPEDIKIIDPCMGSGHILVYAFDVLMQIYESAGYTQRDAAKSILENNLFGLDIDDRAAQLAYFAVMMKARQYNRRILNGESDCNVYAIKESNNFDTEALAKLGDDLRPVAERLIDVFIDAKEYGSIITTDVTLDELDVLDKRLDDVDRMSDYGNLLDMVYAGILCRELDVLIKQARVMVQKYDVVITNPPYMGSNNMDVNLSNYVKKAYSNSKSDLSTVLMEVCGNLCKHSGYVSMINIPVWMFLLSYTELRANILKDFTIINLVHPGRGIFGSDFGTVAFTIVKTNIVEYSASFLRLFDKQGDVESTEYRRERFLNKDKYYSKKQTDFLKIKGAPFAYWISDTIIDNFTNPSLGEILSPKQGLATGDNEHFIRLWNEVIYSDIKFDSEDRDEARQSRAKWFPFNKGGDYRRWYGNRNTIVNWSNDGIEIRNNTDDKGKQKSRPQNLDYYFKDSIACSAITASITSYRYYPCGSIPDVNLRGMYLENEEKWYVLGLLNSKIVEVFNQMLNPTLALNANDIERIPYIKREDSLNAINYLVKENIDITKEDWDLVETSWDFKKHPLI